PLPPRVTTPAKGRWTSTRASPRTVRPSVTCSAWACWPSAIARQIERGTVMGARPPQSIVGPFILPLHFLVFMNRQPSPVVLVARWNFDYQLCGAPDDQPRGQ